MKHSIIALKNILKASLPVLLMAVVAFPCTGFGKKSKKEVPQEASDREIIQMAQEAFNNNNFKLSEHYYTVLLQRYGNNTLDYIIGKFERAHIAVRMKDYDTAVPILREIIQIYDDAPTGELPASYRVLAQNDLKKIPEKARISVDAANGGGNDYYENGDYGDTDFFRELGGYNDGDSANDVGSSDDDGYDDYYEDQGSYSSGFYW